MSAFNKVQNQFPEAVQIKNKLGLAKYAVLGFVGLVLLLGSFETVGPGERGVMVTLGKPSDTILGEGPHLKWPLVSSIRKISVQVQKSEDSSEAATKDLQRIHATVALNWQIDQTTVRNMISDFGNEETIEARIIGPAVSEVLKAATAKMSAEEVLTRRMELKANIDSMLLKRLQTYGLIVKDISLTNLNFTKEFNDAIEKKQVSEQQAQQAVYITQKVTQEANAEIEKAKGEAESVKIKARAQAEAQGLLVKTLTKEVLTMEYLKVWDGKLPQVQSGSSSGMIFNLQNLKNEKND